MVSSKHIVSHLLSEHRSSIIESSVYSTWRPCNMLTKGEQKIVDLIMKLCCIFCLFPHNWDSKKKRMIVSTPLKLYFVCCSCTIYWIYTFYMIWRLKYGYTERQLKDINFELVVHVFWIPVYFTCSIIQLFSIQYRYDLAVLFNQLYEFNQKAGKVSQFCWSLK